MAKKESTLKSLQLSSKYKISYNSSNSSRDIIPTSMIFTFTFAVGILIIFASINTIQNVEAALTI
jgi:hypothetical protein